ncbi:nucleic acid-binding, OB-fold protein [Artemisia annua]|uniref:Nucleic acid-binding, OB-fold protein n=1 Tax=Artemisia annua TaxID=35608 RepID=A0A2U1NC04_ARTAN|nr:nucleic acid-binding, OB-fold protein [Artemisia annua]
MAQISSSITLNANQFPMKNIQIANVIGQVVACAELDSYDKNGKPVKKKPVTLIDAEGNELNVTLWGTYAEQFCEFLASTTDHGKIIAVIQFGMMKFWARKCVCKTGTFGTKLQHLLNCADAISAPEYKDTEDFRKRFLENQQADKSENTASCISIAEKNPPWIGKFPMSNIAELLDVGQIFAQPYIVTFINVWCYFCNCRKSEPSAQFKKKGGGMSDVEVVKRKLSSHPILSILSLKLLQNQLVPQLNGTAQNAKALFQASKQFNKNECHGVFLILWFLGSICNLGSRMKPPDNEATGKSVPEVTPLDLESQTTTPNTQENSMKRGADDEPGSESSNGNKQLVSVKVEKDP